ncbi:MAG: hypothetical protein WCE48_10730, partial [Steroidobacteraceae bacterium]
AEWVTAAAAEGFAADAGFAAAAGVTVHAATQPPTKRRAKNQEFQGLAPESSMRPRLREAPRTVKEARTLRFT